MSFRLVLKSVTLNDLERRNGRTLRYFNEFGKHAFQLITASSSIELFDQESISITHSGEVSLRNYILATIFSHGWTLTVNLLTLLTFNLAFKFHITFMF